jgi:hypothetical protein
MKLQRKARKQNPLEALQNESASVVNILDNVLLDALAPSFMDFGPSDCCAFGPAEWLRVWYVRDWGRTMSYAQWRKLLCFPGDARIALFLTPIPPGLVARQLEQQATALQSGRYLRVMMKRDQSIEENNAYREILEELHHVQVENHPFYYLTVVFGLAGSSKEELDRWTTRIEQQFSDAGLVCDRAINQHEDALKCLLPHAMNELGNHRRNIRLDSLKNLFPFTGEEVVQTDGLFLGHNLANGMTVVLDPFEQTNPHTILVGTTGSGKSFFMKDAIEQHLLAGTRVHVIDVDGEYQSLCEDLGGVYLDMSATSPHTINVLEPNPEEDLAESFLMFKGWLVTALGRRLDSGEAVALDKAYKRTFERFGISETDRATLLRRAPLLSDLHEELLSVPPQEVGFADAQRLANELYPLALGMESRAFNRLTNVNTRNNPLVVFGLKHIEQASPLFSKRVRQIQQFTWTRLMRTAGEGRLSSIPRTVEVLDEAWYLLGREETAEDLAARARRFRKRNGALLLATQHLEDFAQSHHSEVVLSMAATHVLFHQEAAGIDAVSNLFKLTTGEKRFLLQARPGEYLLVTSQLRCAMKKTVPAERHALYSARAKDVAPVKTPV